jgi:predicted transcriptional regulator
MKNTLNKLTPQERSIFRAIYRAGDATRSDIARVLDKKQLNPADKKRLKNMYETGLLQREQKDMPGGCRAAWIYRVAPVVRDYIQSMKN